MTLENLRDMEIFLLALRAKAARLTREYQTQLPSKVREELALIEDHALHWIGVVRGARR